MARMAPVWLLDVDGVINAVVDEDRSHLRAWGDWQQDSVADLPVTWSGRMISRVTTLTSRAEARWCTTWFDLAVVELAPRIGLPSFPITSDSDGAKSPRSDHWWKLRVALSVIDEGRDLIWTDDSIATPHLKTAGEAAWARGVRFLPVVTNEATGLTPPDLDAVEQFIVG